MLMHTFVDFMGPESVSANAYLSASGSTWEYPGAALSCSMVPFFFDMSSGHTAFAKVIWRLVWQPRGDTTCGARLVHADSGPANLVEMAVQDNNSTPSGQSTNTAVDITSAMNALRTGGVFKQLIMQVKGGTNGVLIHRSRLEIVYDVGSAGSGLPVGNWYPVDLYIGEAGTTPED